VAGLVSTTMGQYEIVELIGKGGMAKVYKAWQPSLKRHVALKVLDPALASDPSFVTRFHQEAVSAANLRHPNIVTIHDVGTQDGYNYIAMEYIEGSSLDDRIRSHGALPGQQVVDIITQIGSALEYAHQQGFIHRDIKPANVLIDGSGRAVLTDFGIVKALSGSGMTLSLTQSGSVIGTPYYMSPEQVKDEPVDQRSDLYSLGIVCYEMLTGRVPFNSATTHSVLLAQANEPPPPLREVNPAVPPEVEEVVEKVLAKEPQARYNSAGEFAEALSEAIDGAAGSRQPAQASRGASRPKATPQPERPSSSLVPQQGRAPAGRSRWPVVLLGVGVLGAMMALAVLAFVFLLDMGESTEKTLSDAQAALAAENNTEATGLFDQVLAEEPGNVEALDGLLAVADSYAAGEDYDQAIATFKRVLEEDMDNIPALEGIGALYEAQQDWPRAVVWYEKWMQVAPDDTDAWLAVARTEYELGNFEHSEAYFERAGELAPDQLDSLLGLARVELAVGDFSGSLEKAEQALEMAPNDSAVQDQAVQLLRDLAETESGLAALAALSQWHANHGEDGALEETNQRILAQIPNPMDVNLGEKIRFLGYELRDLPEGQVQTNLFFQMLAPMDKDYQVWLHAYITEEDIALLPPERRQYGFDNWGHPMTDPTSQWLTGAIYRDTTVRQVAPGAYRLRFGVWLPESEDRLATVDDSRGAVELGWQLVHSSVVDATALSRYAWLKLEDQEPEQALWSIERALEREPKNLDALLAAGAVYGMQGDSERLDEIAERLQRFVPNPQDILLGDVMRFVGYDINTLSDDRVQVDLYFQSLEPTDTDYRVWLHAYVREDDIAILAPERQQYGYDNWGHPMTYPTSKWMEGAVYRDRTVRPTAPGEYRFEFGVWLPDSEIRLSAPDDPQGAVDLGWVRAGRD
jgi:tetratricopeptide (TPR) repeat protein